MMYQVGWLPRARNQLAEIWLQAADRDTITRAAHAIDLRLQRNPEDDSESRDQPDPVAFEPPLGFRFRILDKKRLVLVLAVWRFSQRIS